MYVLFLLPVSYRHDSLPLRPPPQPLADSPEIAQSSKPGNMRTDVARREQRGTPQLDADSTGHVDFKPSSGHPPRSRSMHRSLSRPNEDPEDLSSSGILRNPRSRRSSSSTSPEPWHGDDRRDTRRNDVHRPATTGRDATLDRGRHSRRKSRSPSRSPSRGREARRSRRSETRPPLGDDEEKMPDDSVSSAFTTRGLLPDESMSSIFSAKVVPNKGDRHGVSIADKLASYGDGGVGGMEPAVKGCGIMTTATFFKMVRRDEGMCHPPQVFLLLGSSSKRALHTRKS